MGLWDIKQDFDLRDFVFAGDDAPLQFLIGTGPILEVDAAVAIGATTITVKPLKATIPSGAKVRFRVDPDEPGLVVTLAAEAPIGTTTLSVSAIGGSLVQGWQGRRCQNLTGWTLEMTVRLDPSTTVELTKSATVQTADEGDVRVTLTAEDTGTTLTGRGYGYRLRRTNVASARAVALGGLTIRN